MKPVVVLSEWTVNTPSMLRTFYNSIQKFAAEKLLKIIISIVSPMKIKIF
jgi:hypothetical protein